MASSRRTYDTDVITLRKVFAKDPGNSNVPALRTLTADGLGGTYWAIPSSLGLNPSFNEIITSAGTYTADLSYNKFRLLAGENIGMLNGSPGSNETILFAKAFSQFDISGENTIVAYNSNNQLDSSVTLAGQGGITLRGDPATNTLFIVGPASNTYIVSTGIYGFSQIKVTEATSTITPYVQGLPGTFITATSPSTLLRMIGIEDIQLSTNVTSGSIFFTISTFTSKGYLDISANAYSAYPSTLSTVSSLYVQIPQFLSGITGAILEGSYNYSTLSSGLQSLAFSTSQEFDRVWGQVAERAYIQQLLDTEIVLNNNIQSTSVGLGTLGYISTGGGAVVGQEQLVSTVQGLGTAGYISSGVAGDVTTANLVSTVEGLGSSGYFSSLSTIITSTIFNTGAISTNSLEVFGTATLTCGGSTILRGPIYLGGPIFVAGSFTGLPNTIVTPANQQSTVAGLGTSRYVSTLSLQSTVRGLGSASYISSSQLLSSLAGLGSLGYLSSLNGFTMSTGNVFASSLNLLDVFTNDVNYLTVSSGSLLLNGAKVSDGGGGGGGNVVQIVAGTGISVDPAGGTGVVTIINTGPTITNVNDAISSFSTALGPVGGGGGGAAYNFSTVSSVYGSTFNTGLLFASTMNTATILPSQSNLWVAVGYGDGVTIVDTLQYSGDGRNWSNSMSGGFSTAGKGVAYNGSLWVAVGANGTSLGSIQTSTDGKNWFNITSGGFSAGGNGIAYNGTIWIAVGNNGGDTATSIQYSVDGKSWSGIVSGGFSGNGEGIAWNGSYWVATGQGGSAAESIQYSLDGLNWISATTGGFATAGKGIAWNGSLWVAAGDDISSLLSLQYSGDGKNWSNAVSGGFSSAGWKVAWNGSLWVAVGDDTDILKSIQYSMDGISWNDIASGGFTNGSDGYGIAWNGSYWVAVGAGNTAPESVQISIDGINWTSATTGGFSFGGVGIGFSSNLAPGYSQQNLTILSQNIPLFLTPNNQILAKPSSLVVNDMFVVDRQWKRIGVNCNTPAYDLDVNGIGHFLTLSTLGLNISSLNGFNYPTILPSTVAGLATVGYVSTTGLTSTVRGLGTVGYVSTTGLISTVAGLGTIGFLSSLSNVTLLSTQQVNASSIRAPIISTSLLNTSSLTSVFLSSLAINASSITAPILSTFALNVSSINGALPGTGSGNGSSLTVSTGYLYASSMAFVNMAQTNTNLWVAVGNDTVQNVKYSYDGINWSSAAGTKVFNNDVGYGVAWNGRMWVAVGYDSTQSVKYSYDGINWSSAAGTNVFNANIGYGVAWNGRMWVAVGYDTVQPVKYSYDAINWFSAAGTNLFDNDVGRGVAWNGRLWVAVGDDGTQTIKYSYDGINWSNAAGSQVFNANIGSGVAWNGRLWVAVGQDSTQSVKYSYDGINWSSAAGAQVFGSSIGYGVAWNGRLWVAVGQDSTQSVKYSYDGINWFAAAGAQVFNGVDNIGYGVAWNGKMWVAVGEDSTQPVKYSYDGINWTNAATPSPVFDVGIGYGIAYSSNVIPSYNQTNFEIEPQNIPIFLRSTNQLSFTQSTIIANNTLFVDTTNRVGINTGAPQTDLDVYGIGRFLAVSSFALNASSITGINVSTGSLYASSITNVNIPPSRTNLWVAGGTDSANNIQYSSDGITWANATGGLIFSGGVFGIAWNGTMWVATGLDATQNIKYSYDGINWLSAAGTKVFTSFGLCFAWNGRLWICVGQNSSGTANIKYSTDGINWDNVTSSGFATGGYGIAWNGKMWVAVGADSPAANTIKYSYDGLNWSNSSSGGFAATGRGVAWNGRMWVAVGTGATTASIKYSFDGINWNNIASGGFAAEARAVAWNGSLWVAVGDGATTASIQYSYDGINWSTVLSGGFATTGFGIAWNGRVWVAVGVNAGVTGSIQYSADGLRWSNSASGGGSTNMRGIAYSANLTPSYNQTNFEIEPQNIPVFIRSTNQMSFTLSSMILNNTLTVDTTNRVGINTGTPQTDLDVYGIGRFLTVSTFALNASSITAPVISSSLLNTSSLTSVFLSTFAVNASSITASVISSFALNASSITGINVSTGSLYASSITNVNIPPSRTNLWVALGSGGGSIQYSADGISWTGASGSFASTAYSAGWNGRLWVAVGAGAGVASIKYSYDGITWANVSSGGFLSVGRGVAWNGRIWVAVGNRNTADTDTIQYSYDGFTWVSPSSGGFSTTGYGVAWNGYMWIAVGNGGGTAGSIKYSYDGIAWANILTGGFTSFGFAAAWNGRFWVAVGSSTPFASTIQYSYDGINWTNSSSGGFGSLVGLGIAWNGSLWVAVGIGAGLASIKYSRDGFTWTNISSGGFAVQGFSVAWNGRIWIAVGDNNTSIGSIQYSTDGISWSSNSSGGFSTEGFGIAYSANLTPSYNQTNFEIEPQNIPVFLRSTNTMSFTQSSIILNNTLFVDTSDRVGINIGTPQYTLDVNGTTRSLYSTILANGAYGVVMASGGTADTGSANQTSIQGYNIGAASKANLHLQPTGGNLGVGIPTGTAPSYTLDVRGQSRSLYSTFLINGNYGLAIASGGTADTGSANQTSIQGYNFGSGTTANLHLQPTGGNLGVGITTGTAPLYTLDAYGTTRLQSTFIQNNSVSGQNPSATLDRTAADIGLLGGTATSAGDPYPFYGPHIRSVIPANVYQDKMRLDITTSKGTNDNTQVPRISVLAGAAGGLVGINTSSPNYMLDIEGNSRISSLIVGTPTTIPSTSAFLLTLTRDLAVKPFTTVWNTSSDKRIKENIVDADYDRCYDDVKSLQLRRFTWASTFFNDAGGYDKRVLGFIAQEVSSVVPKAVTVTEANGYSNFHYLNIDQLNMSLYGAVKRTILDKEYMESTIKGQRVHIETLQGTTTCILSTLEGLQGR